MNRFFLSVFLFSTFIFAACGEKVATQTDSFDIKDPTLESSGHPPLPISQWLKAKNNRFNFDAYLYFAEEPDALKQLQLNINRSCLSGKEQISDRIDLLAQKKLPMIALTPTQLLWQPPSEWTCSSQLIFTNQHGSTKTFSFNSYTFKNTPLGHQVKTTVLETEEREPQQPDGNKILFINRLNRSLIHFSIQSHKIDETSLVCQNRLIDLAPLLGLRNEIQMDEIDLASLKVRKEVPDIPTVELCRLITSYKDHVVGFSHLLKVQFSIRTPKVSGERATLGNYNGDKKNTIQLGHLELYNPHNQSLYFYIPKKVDHATHLDFIRAKTYGRKFGGHAKIEVPVNLEIQSGIGVSENDSHWLLALPPRAQNSITASTTINIQCLRRPGRFPNNVDPERGAYVSFQPVLVRQIIDPNSNPLKKENIVENFNLVPNTIQWWGAKRSQIPPVAPSPRWTTNKVDSSWLCHHRP